VSQIDSPSFVHLWDVFGRANIGAGSGVFPMAERNYWVAVGVVAAFAGLASFASVLAALASH
jgi:hypothetical protein